MRTIAIDQPVNPIVLGIPSFDTVSWEAKNPNVDQPVHAAKPPATKKATKKAKAAPTKKK
jgi:hypothetical protein